MVKFVLSKKATKFDKIFTDLKLTTECQIDGEDFVNFCGLLSKHELYIGSGEDMFMMRQKVTKHQKEFASRLQKTFPIFRYVVRS